MSDTESAKTFFWEDDEDDDDDDHKADNKEEEEEKKTEPNAVMFDAPWAPLPQTHPRELVKKHKIDDADAVYTLSSADTKRDDTPPPLLYDTVNFSMPDTVKPAVATATATATATTTATAAVAPRSVEPVVMLGTPQMQPQVEVPDFFFTPSPIPPPSFSFSVASGVMTPTPRVVSFPSLSPTRVALQDPTASSPTPRAASFPSSLAATANPTAATVSRTPPPSTLHPSSPSPPSLPPSPKEQLQADYGAEQDDGYKVEDEETEADDEEADDLFLESPRFEVEKALMLEVETTFKGDRLLWAEFQNFIQRKRKILLALEDMKKSQHVHYDHMCAHVQIQQQKERYLVTHINDLLLEGYSHAGWCRSVKQAETYRILKQYFSRACGTLLKTGFYVGLLWGTCEAYHHLCVTQAGAAFVSLPCT
jgi:hypothetical protein